MLHLKYLRFPFPIFSNCECISSLWIWTHMISLDIFFWYIKLDSSLLHTYVCTVATLTLIICLQDPELIKTSFLQSLYLVHMPATFSLMNMEKNFEIWNIEKIILIMIFSLDNLVTSQGALPKICFLFLNRFSGIIISIIVCHFQWLRLCFDHSHIRYFYIFQQLLLNSEVGKHQWSQVWKMHMRSSNCFYSKACKNKKHFCGSLFNLLHC